MPIEIKVYEKPPAGIHNAVCCEVTEAMVEKPDWKTKKLVPTMMLIFNFELEATQSDGRRFIVTRGAEFFVNSGLSASNPLGKFLTSWGGGTVPLPAEHLEAIKEALNSGKYVGANATLGIIHSTSKSTGNEFAMIDSAYPSTLPEDRRMTPSAQYTPWERRQGNFNQSVPAQAGPPSTQAKDKSPVPF